ncbi:hypothetical protein DY000_02030860 [Brassica cretica]|uniref:Uncharacterized protein n=1 Tax=Brassica cretica TaxID=69181 RepID=A0ABQ7DVP9_BRACR|nr:hypothetical protein DY000_02030860 [Brassica cretica]
MSFGGSLWCRPMSMDAHRSTDHDEDRSTDYSNHRSTSSAKSTAECSAVRIMTHEEFAEKHPHPPSPFYVHAQQYQKQQGQTPAILRRSCSLGTNDPQRLTFHIARCSSFHVDRFSYPTVDRHPTFIVDRSTSFDIDRYYTAYIDRSSVAKHGCDCYSQT